MAEHHEEQVGGRVHKDVLKLLCAFFDPGGHCVQSCSLSVTLIHINPKNQKPPPESEQLRAIPSTTSKCWQQQSIWRRRLTTKSTSPEHNGDLTGPGHAKIRAKFCQHWGAKWSHHIGESCKLTSLEQGRTLYPLVTQHLRA